MFGMLHATHFHVSFPEPSLAGLWNGYKPMGMFKFVANVVTLCARPFSSKSERMRIVSRGLAVFVGQGYSRDSVNQSRPTVSNCMFIGLRNCGSAATSCTSKPGGTRNFFCCSSGASGSVVRTFSAKGSLAAKSFAPQASVTAMSVTNFILLSLVSGIIRSNGRTREHPTFNAATDRRAHPHRRQRAPRQRLLAENRHVA